jgi:hypothetical protein
MKINLLAVMCQRTIDDDMTDLFDEKIGNMKGAFSSRSLSLAGKRHFPVLLCATYAKSHWIDG